MWAGKGCQGGRVPDYRCSQSHPQPVAWRDWGENLCFEASRLQEGGAHQLCLSFLGDESLDETVQSLGAEVAKEFLVPVPGEASQGKGIEE